MFIHIFESVVAMPHFTSTCRDPVLPLS